MAEIDDDVRDNVHDTNNDSEDGDAGYLNHAQEQVSARQERAVMVMGDPMRIEQVIVNLVNNAIRHTTSGFVKVKVRRAKFLEPVPSETSKASSTAGAMDANMLLGCYRQLDESGTKSEGEEGKASAGGKELGRKSVVIEVRDSGCGICRKDRGDIFGMFTRGNRGCERYEPGVGISGGGVGIGLTLCQQLVAAHDSNISVQSAINFGSSFSFSLACTGGLHTREKNPKRTVGSSEASPISSDASPICANDLRSHLLAAQAIEETFEKASIPIHQTTIKQSAASQRPEDFIESATRSPHQPIGPPSRSGESSMIRPENSECRPPRPSTLLLVTPEAVSFDDILGVSCSSPSRPTLTLSTSTRTRAIPSPPSSPVVSRLSSLNGNSLAGTESLSKSPRARGRSFTEALHVDHKMQIHSGMRTRAIPSPPSSPSVSRLSSLDGNSPAGTESLSKSPRARGRSFTEVLEDHKTQIHSGM